MFKFIRKQLLRDAMKRMTHIENAILVLVNSPVYENGEHAGFNGQKGRKNIFSDLVGAYRFANIIETGTYLGDTAGHMAATTGLPVISCELDRLAFALSKMRLKDFPSISLHNLDSRRFLENLSRDPDITGRECFIYLDAHWGKDCPLREELEIISANWDRFVVMIDDFQVPGDDGYRYDRYGLFFKLKLSLLRPVMDRYGLCAFFPSLPSSEESKADPRGCVILAKDDAYAQPLRSLPSIRSHAP